MNFFKVATTPAPLLEVPAALWAALMAHLREQGAGVRESGAFLLGRKTDAGRIVQRFVPYEHLQHDAFSNDYVSLKADSFAKLWEVCRATDMTVVADVHTHPGAAWQSHSDRTNPMIARAGHVAVILPDYAQSPVDLSRIGVFEYRGAHAWDDRSPARGQRFLNLSRWSWL